MVQHHGDEEGEERGLHLCLFVFVAAVAAAAAVVTAAVGGSARAKNRAEINLTKSL